MMTIRMIVSDNCPICPRARAIMAKAIAMSGVEVTVKELSMERDTDAAVKLALEDGLDYVPSFAIGNSKFNEDRFTAQELAFSIKSVAMSDPKA